jgi:hypothetical protein
MLVYAVQSTWGNILIAKKKWPVLLLFLGIALPSLLTWHQVRHFSGVCFDDLLLMYRIAINILTGNL